VTREAEAGRLPTRDEFEDAQEAHQEDGDYDGPMFPGAESVDEFEHYSEFISFRAAQKAWQARGDAREIRWKVDSVENAAKGLLIGAGVAFFIDKVVGDARL